MKTLHTLAVALAAVVFNASPANAGPAVAPGERNPSAAGPADRFGTIGGVNLQLNADTDDERGSVALELPLDRTRANRFALILSSPVNDDDVAMPASLDGLANGTKLTLRVGHFALYPFVGEPNIVAQDIGREARANCRVRRTAQHAPQEQVDACDLESTPVSNLVAAYTDRLREFNAMLVRAPRDFGFEASIGVHDFDFVDPATLTEQSDRKVQWSVSGHFTQYFRRSRTAFTLSVGYERAYEAADEEIFCPANPNNVVIRCITASGAPPERNESLLLSAGLRHQFARDGVLRNFAIAPTITYDALDDVVGVDMPIYFLSNSDGALTGGVRVGYRSDREDRFSVGIFIGTSFGLGD